MDQTDQITRQTGLAPDVRTSEFLPCHNSFLRSLIDPLNPLGSPIVLYWLFERKENRLKNHTLQRKLLPQLIATTIHPPQPYPDVRRVLPSGEVREWPNRAVSKTAVLATGPWVRSPPSPPNQARSCRRP